MSDNLKLYNIKNEYIKYIEKFQEHIWENEEKGRLRPYVGVVIDIDDFKYYAPLTSPKPKHESMKESLDIIKITHKSKLICIINLNNLIPVHDSDISLIDFDKEEEKYVALLQTELIEIRRKKDLIINNSKIIYNKVTKFGHEGKNFNLVKRCYNFKQLEQKCLEYLVLKQISKTQEQVASRSES